MMKIHTWLISSVLLIALHSFAQAESTQEATTADNSPKTPASLPAESTETAQPEMTETMAKGKQLHEANCMTGCHNTSVYTRENRKITHLEGLKARVQGCANNFNLPWFDDELAAVVDYLNHTYYLFETPEPENQPENQSEKID